MSKLEKQLTLTRAELNEINKDLLALEATKAEALKSSKAYAEWRAAVDTKTLERERLESVVSTTEAEIERTAQAEAANAVRKRREALEKTTAELAKRIAQEGPAAAAVLIQLAEEAKANAEAVERLNRELPDDERLLHADHLARHRDPAPRQDIEETVVDLWTFEQSGEIVGDPDGVVEQSYERGFIPGGGRNIPVVRQRFKQIRYLAPDDREWTEPLASVLRLPNFSGTGMLFDRGRVMEPAARRELVELTLAPDAPAKPSTSEAA